MREHNLKRTAVHLLGGVLAFCGSVSCGPTVEWDSYGTVVNKDHRLPYTSIEMMPSLDLSGRLTLAPTTQFHPEAWIIMVKVCTKADVLFPPETPVTCQNVNYFVNRQLYEQIEKGQNVNIPLK